MITLKRFSVLFFLLLGCLSLRAQNQPPTQQPYRDGDVVPNPRYDENIVIPWPHLREADAIYRRRIWRIIDVREKNNKVMTWPRNGFGDIILKYARAGQLNVYDNPDSMITPLTPEEALKRSSIQLTTEMIDSAQNPDIMDPAFDVTSAVMKTVDVNEPIRWTSVNQYRVMEEWFFDKNHGKIVARIISIEPMKDIMVNGNAIGGKEPMFTIKYAELREKLVKEQMFNRYNDAMRLTYDDFFENRYFSSYIIKESNMYDYYIKDMPEYEKDNLAALLEADRIKQELFILEHDLWEY